MKWLILLGLLGSLGLLLVRASQAGEVPQAGQTAPDFKLMDQDSKEHSLADYRGKWLVLYFYPKDDTPGCTTEACAFRDDWHQLSALGAEVVGVSLDDSISHAEFAKKYHLPFPLLADKSAEVASRYGVLMNFGLFKMAKRYTFLINPQGKISKVYEKVDSATHSGEIIADLKALLAQTVTSEKQGK